MVVGFIENPVMLEREAGEIVRVVMICLADAGKLAINVQTAMRLEINSSLAFSPNCSSM